MPPQQRPTTFKFLSGNKFTGNGPYPHSLVNKAHAYMKDVLTDQPNVLEVACNNEWFGNDPKCVQMLTQLPQQQGAGGFGELVQNEIIHAEATSSSSTTVSRSRSTKASVQNYRKRVWILTSQRTTAGFAALVDTGCWAGNWISLEVLRETHPTMTPSPLPGPKVPYHFLDGSDVYPLGTVRLQWEFERTCETSFDKVYSADFNVTDTSLIQMVLGARWIQENEHVDRASPVGVLVPKNRKLSADEEERIRALEEEQEAAAETAKQNRQAAREKMRNKQSQQYLSNSSTKSPTKP